ncbi:unnamed protein product [Oncorhynchus mykiss]|uniref:ATP-dependent RNA helicase n=1 Tax=Oncorhynchus mykiss TaxID=8022 RepID=A0A060YZH6_ONCMY|nr:unnamed protein product [Oncorhynchus mykiss]
MRTVAPLICKRSSYISSQRIRMTEQDVENELLDYEEDDVVGDLSGGDILSIKKERVKGSYVSIHSSGFRDFLLKPELLRAIVDCGFEHPSEVQHECIPQAILGMDVLCQAKSGMGKTAVFVLATLQQLEPVTGQVFSLSVSPSLPLSLTLPFSSLSLSSSVCLSLRCHSGLFIELALLSWSWSISL